MSLKVNLAGQGAIVTGGGSGICLAFTKSLFQAGCNVLICDLGLHKEAVQWIESLDKGTASDSKQNGTDKGASNGTNGVATTTASGPRLVFHRTDVSDWKQLEEIFDVYEREFGGVPSIVCPGAGIYEPSAPNFWNERDQDYYKIIRVNLEHPLRLTRIAIRKFVQQSDDDGNIQGGRGGRIILVSSTGAQKPSILTPLYGAAKQGISNLARGMEKLYDLAHIRVVACAPGPTMSPLMYDHPEAFRFVDPEKDRLASVEEVAHAMMAVTFDDKRFAPGTVLEVTAGDTWREVQLLNDPGPAAHAFTSRKEEAVVDIVKALEADRAAKK